MKHVAVLLSFIFLLTGVKAQYINEYKASNGITYRVGDTVRLGKGSAVNGDFLCLQIGSWKGLSEKRAARSNDSGNVGRAYSHTNLLIKKIRRYTIRGTEKVCFLFKANLFTDYVLAVEDAIDACEVMPCVNEEKLVSKNPSIADQLIKLKELYDKGAITGEEYAAAKKKLLDL